MVKKISGCLLLSSLYLGPLFPFVTILCEERQNAAILFPGSLITASIISLSIYLIR